jgi:phosphoribosyl 1,2-cyclic phosphodiesterase
VNARPQPSDDALVLCNLASGSRGNSTFIARNGSGLLVDAGLSGRQTTLRLEARGLDPATLRGIVITHEHRDHTNGARVLARRYHVPVFVHEAVRPKVKLDGVADVRTFGNEAVLEIAGLEVRPFTIPHDSVEPLAYVVGDGRNEVGVATDMGMPTRLTVERLRRCRAVVLEFNHDLQMLMEGPYPWWLKQRVRSRLGHLSNEDALEILQQLVDRGVEVALLGHLSQENNRPELVHALALEQLARTGNEHVSVSVLEQDRPGPLVTLDREVAVSTVVDGEEAP